jgi:hypothetical protein
MPFDVPHTCPVCTAPLVPYRLATVQDQLRTPQGLIVQPTGPAFLPAHGCLGDHHPLDL